MAKIAALVRDFQDANMMDNPKRTKRMASNLTIAPQAWTPQMVTAWMQAQNMIAHSVAPYHPKEGILALF